jgi:hypothetical protein
MLGLAVRRLQRSRLFWAGLLSALAGAVVAYW